MSTPGPGRHPTLDQIRRLVLALVLLGCSGVAAELLLLDHVESWQQWVPLVLLGAGFVSGAVLAVRPGTTVLTIFRTAMVSFVLAGLAGLYLHYSGNVEWELERSPELGGVRLVWESLRGATPALAPGVMIQLGLMGLVVAYRWRLTRKEA